MITSGNIIWGLRFYRHKKCTIYVTNREITLNSYLIRGILLWSHVNIITVLRFLVALSIFLLFPWDAKPMSTEGLINFFMHKNKESLRYQVNLDNISEPYDGVDLNLWELIIGQFLYLLYIRTYEIIA